MTNTKDFDPNAPGITGNNVFGLPYNANDAKIVFIPVPWDATVSYSDGTAMAPEAIFNASMQVDLYDPAKPDAWKTPMAMADVDPLISQLNDETKRHSASVISCLEEGVEPGSSAAVNKSLNEVNAGCLKLNRIIFEQTSALLARNKLVGIIGGEHSVPLGFMEALGKHKGAFGILQIDAHADLRNAYEGFTWSHASAMYNALQYKHIEKLVQLGIRDYCEEEVNFIRQSGNRIKTFFDRDIKAAQFEGKQWKDICNEIISNLPERVYISFDIDGLDPKLCPSTGTPVPGGLDWNEVIYLLELVADSGKKIIGFDLCEVAPGNDEWDANVGARLLYKLANLMAKTNGI